MATLPSFQDQLPTKDRLKLSKTLRTEHQLPSIGGSKKVKQFIPFVQQRDGIGRLINKSSTKYDTTNSVIPSTRLSKGIKFTEPHIFQYERGQQHESNIQKFQSQFQIQSSRSLKPQRALVKAYSSVEKSNPQKKMKFDNFRIVQRKYTLNEQKINPLQTRRNFVFRELNQNGLPFSTKEIIYTSIINDEIQKPVDNFKMRRANTMTCRQQQSLQVKKHKHEPNCRCQKVLKKQKQQQEMIKSEKIMKMKLLDDKQKQKQLKVLASREHPQLKRFKQMEKLSIQVICDVEQSHATFLHKIRQTKMMAIKIKQELALD